MKKSRLLIITAIAFVTLTVMASLSSSALYNDAAFDGYTNLSQNSAIPGLFRNDNVLPSYKNYPPVISDGIEYVPLEIFYGLSGVKISYSEDGTNFYIQNKKTNKYISFNILENYAMTSGGGTVVANVPSFYNVYYVPLRVVCSATGIGCDSYNDGVNKLYAIKVYTVPGLSAKELMKIHAPAVYGTENSEQGGKDELDNSPKPPATEEFPPRTVYMMFDSSTFENAGKTLDFLSRFGYKALFAVKTEDILNYPDTVRRIITGGHTLCLDIPENNGEIYKEGGLENAVKLAEDTLYDIVKTKTRLVMVESTNYEHYNESQIAIRLGDMGLSTVTTNVESESDILPSYHINNTLTTKIKNLNGTKNHARAFVMLHHTDAGRQGIYTIFGLARDNKGVWVDLFTEVESQ